MKDRSTTANTCFELRLDGLHPSLSIQASSRSRTCTFRTARARIRCSRISTSRSTRGRPSPSSGRAGAASPSSRTPVRSHAALSANQIAAFRSLIACWIDNRQVYRGPARPALLRPPARHARRSWRMMESVYGGLPFKMNIKNRDLSLTFRSNYSAKVEDPHIYATACAWRLCRCADFLPWCSSCCGI